MRNVDQIAREDYGCMVKRTSEKNAYYYFVGQNGWDIRNCKGEKLCVEIGECINPGGPHSLPDLWLKNGYISERLDSWWSVDTYVTNEDDECYGAYNPQHRYDGKRCVLNFKWVLPATRENFKKIMDEVIRQWLHR